MLEKDILEKRFVEKIKNLVEPEFLDTNLLSERFFSSSATFVDIVDLKLMKLTITTIQKILKYKNFRQEILKEFPSSLGNRFSEGGVFLSFDFHLSEDGPKLIEINTNAGGAFLQTKLIEAQKECCTEMTEALVLSKDIEALELPKDIKSLVQLKDTKDLERKFVQIFLEEWNSAGKQGLPKFIAIVDETPKDQFLYPEFLLFRDLFSNFGIRSEIVSPEFLRLDEDGFLYYENQRIDLIYNRLTDFYLSKSEQSKIRSAWEKENVVVTPNPLDYELYAKKTNFLFWKNEEFLQSAGVSKEDQRILSNSIPLTGLVKRKNSEQLWSERKKFFFKPVFGFGSKAVYRGDKLTKSTFQNILDGENIFQEFIPPSERILLKDGKKVPYKMDLRVYVFREEILLLAARLYQGQTTNFRAPEGGFSPVCILG